VQVSCGSVERPVVDDRGQGLQPAGLEAHGSTLVALQHLQKHLLV